MQIKKRIKDYKESLIALNPFSIAFSFISWNLGARLCFIASMTDSLESGNVSLATAAPSKTMFNDKMLPASFASPFPSIG